MRSLLFALLVFSIILSACNLYPQDDYEEFYVVESYLIAQNKLPEVYLSTTAPVSSEYSFSNFAVIGADIQINLLAVGEGSPVEQVFPYQMDTDGVYKPVIPHEVLPARTYQLRITDIPNDPTASPIIGYTAVPDTFSTKSQIPDTAVYQSENQIQLDITPSVNTERQSYFIFTTIALNPSLENFTPLYADFYDENEDELGDFVKTSSGIVNEANFETKPDGTVTLKYPWLAVAFFENNQIVANIIDDNIYDFLRSQSVQLGGSTLSPGEIPNVIYRLEGGIGVFGSLAADTIQTYIKRPTPSDF
tara:strand:+ start:3830 stop:4744 length:915 start_codon:yes stop_codon:yes gene_type:complete